MNGFADATSVLGTSYRKSIATVMVMFAIIVGVLGGLNVDSADAAHGGAYKGLDGTAMPSSVVCLVNEVSAYAGCVYTNGFGQFHLNMESGHSYYLLAYQASGCNVFVTTTNWFYVAPNAANNLSWPRRLVPDRFWYKGC